MRRRPGSRDDYKYLEFVFACVEASHRLIPTSYALTLSVCKWGYVFLRSEEIMNLSTRMMEKSCFAFDTEKELFNTIMATLTKVNGNGIKSMDMENTRPKLETCE